MPIQNATEFLAQFGLLINNEAVQAWQWSHADDTFGKSISWNIGADHVEAVATVDLQATQATLSISERELGGRQDEGETDVHVTFTALIQFEDRTVTVDGNEMPFTATGIGEAVNQFNERI